MRARILSLIGALALSYLAVTGAGTAQAACSLSYCSQARQECLSGCPCAFFTCNPVSCTSSCSCPIFCP
ncbi:MAG: hypothetical protein QOF89_2821 [Acidobacteriota bacterium]|jgi:hypothetical protein|nr:hypothetical protein [Acidobacteriota bacterium]